MKETEHNLLTGTLSLGFMITWIGFIPFYGPFLSYLNNYSYLYSNLFIASHVILLISGAYYYARYVRPEIDKRINQILPAIIFLLTLILSLKPGQDNFYQASFIFIAMGMSSGWIISRWMAWFSGESTVGKRASIIGKAFALSVILISAATFILIQSSNGILLSLLFSATIFALGGFLNIKLPVPKKIYKPPININLINSMPPLFLMILATIGYSAIAVVHKSIISWGVENPIFPVLLFIPYLLIGIYLSGYADRKGYNLLFILAFLLGGFGFIFLASNSGESTSSLLAGLLINTSFLLMRLFFWLSLVYFQKPLYAPLPMAIGISFELTIISLFYSLASEILPDPESSQIVIGYGGIIMILIGFAIFAGLNDRVFSIPASITHTLLSNSNYYSLTGTINEGLVPLAHHVATIGKLRFEETVVNQYKLTKREAGIAYMIAVGYSYNEIRQEFHITSNTLKYHLRNIFSKLTVSCREQAVQKLYAAVSSLS